MKLSSKELKRQARQTLTGQYGLPMEAFVISQFLTAAAYLPFQLFFQNNPDHTQMVLSLLASLIISLLSAVMNCGLLSIHLNLARGKEAKLTDLFRYFTTRPDYPILAGLLLMGILFLLTLPAFLCTGIAFGADTALWYFLAAVIWIVTLFPLCYVNLSYGLLYYLLIEHPDGELRDMFRTSRCLMHGNKGRLLYITFSFAGMYFLCLLSLGIGFLWIVPYMTQTKTVFYRNIIQEI